VYLTELLHLFSKKELCDVCPVNWHYQQHPKAGKKFKFSVPTPEHSLNQYGGGMDLTFHKFSESYQANV
jgi:hypothetical protein